jgi:hypothetical protein
MDDQESFNKQTTSMNLLNTLAGQMNDLTSYLKETDSKESTPGKLVDEENLTSNSYIDHIRDTRYTTVGQVGSSTNSIISIKMGVNPPIKTYTIDLKRKASPKEKDTSGSDSAFGTPKSHYKLESERAIKETNDRLRNNSDLTSLMERYSYNIAGSTERSKPSVDESIYTPPRGRNVNISYNDERKNSMFSGQVEAKFVPKRPFYKLSHIELVNYFTIKNKDVYSRVELRIVKPITNDFGKTKTTLNTIRDRNKAVRMIQRWWRRILLNYKQFITRLTSCQAMVKGFLMRRSTWIRLNMSRKLNYLKSALVGTHIQPLKIIFFDNLYRQLIANQAKNRRLQHFNKIMIDILNYQYKKQLKQAFTKYKYLSRYVKPITSVAYKFLKSLCIRFDSKMLYKYLYRWKKFNFYHALSQHEDHKDHTTINPLLAYCNDDETEEVTMKMNMSLRYLTILYSKRLNELKYNYFHNWHGKVKRYNITCRFIEGGYFKLLRSIQRSIINDIGECMFSKKRRVIALPSFDIFEKIARRLNSEHLSIFLLKLLDISGIFIRKQFILKRLILYKGRREKDFYLRISFGRWEKVVKLLSRHEYILSAKYSHACEIIEQIVLARVFHELKDHRKIVKMEVVFPEITEGVSDRSLNHSGMALNTEESIPLQTIRSMGSDSGFFNVETCEFRSIVKRFVSYIKNRIMFGVFELAKDYTLHKRKLEYYARIRGENLASVFNLLEIQQKRLKKLTFKSWAKNAKILTAELAVKERLKRSEEVEAILHDVVIKQSIKRKLILKTRLRQWKNYSYRVTELENLKDRGIQAREKFVRLAELFVSSTCGDFVAIFKICLRILRSQRIENLLIKHFNKVEGFKYYSLKKSFRKWFIFMKLIKSMKVRKVIKIQRAFRYFNSLSKEKNIVTRSVLSKFVNLKIERQLATITIFFEKWLRMTRYVQLNHSARVLQSYIKMINNKSRGYTKSLSIHKGSVIFYSVLTHHICNRVLNKIIRESTRRLFIKIYLTLRNKYSYNLKYAFRKIQNRTKKTTGLNNYALKIQNAFKRYKNRQLFSQRSKTSLKLLFRKLAYRKIGLVLRSLSFKK